ncbi:MAG TPA: hypothetical protein VFL03_15875, partial [Candidatus Limnocylindrales bacterium]|nr:hypothetical protein [Candidatus Limnocylindrales bacterium]
KVHQARGAVSGLLAAATAARGLDGSRAPFTAAEGGLLAAYADGGRPEALTDGLGEAWHLDELTLRRWPGSSSVQPLIEAALEVAEGMAEPDEVATVEVRLPPRSYDLGAASTWHDQLGAMQSPAWVAAAILTDGSWSLDQVAAERRRDETVNALARRVAVVRDDALPRTVASITITLADGTTRSARCDEPLGSPARPLTRDDIIAKLADAAAGIGWHDRTDAIVAAVDGLPTAPSVTPLLRLLARSERDTR